MKGNHFSELCTKLFEAISWFLITWWLTSCSTQNYTNNWPSCLFSLLKLWVPTLFSVVEYSTLPIRSSYVVLINPTHYYGKRPCAWSTLDSLVHYLVPRPVIMVFGLGMRLCVCKHAKLQSGILHNRQQPQCCDRLLLTRLNLKQCKDTEWLLW